MVIVDRGPGLVGDKTRRCAQNARCICNSPAPTTNLPGPGPARVEAPVSAPLDEVVIAGAHNAMNVETRLLLPNQHFGYERRWPRDPGSCSTSTISTAVKMLCTRTARSVDPLAVGLAFDTLLAKTPTGSCPSSGHRRGPSRDVRARGSRPVIAIGSALADPRADRATPADSSHTRSIVGCAAGTTRPTRRWDNNNSRRARTWLRRAPRDLEPVFC